jgi:hypothetical protein
MKKRTREEARLYARARRARIKAKGVNLQDKRRLVVVAPEYAIDKLLAIRRDSIPISFGDCNIYFLFQDEEVVYVGQSKSLLPRIAAHRGGNRDTDKKIFNAIALVEVTPENVNSEELKYIKWFSPRYNKVGVPKIPVTPIASSLQEEYELRLKILRGRVAILERELGEVKKLLPKKTDSPYRGF